MNAGKKARCCYQYLAFEMLVDYLDNPKCLNKSNKS